MIEEMAKTLHDNGYISADMVRNWDGLPEAYKRAYRAGLLAVLEKHIQPMLAEAFDTGAETQHGFRPAHVRIPSKDRSLTYAARIIEQMKEQKP